MKTCLYIALFFSTVGCSPKQDERFTIVSDTAYHIKELGKGKPTVILESGMASSMDTWKSIPDSVSKFSNVLAYDRAGIGKSDTTSNERTIPNMVQELRQILKKENIKPPYIYVAHSMGSYLARYYAVNFPEEISAILLVDPSPDKLYDDYTQQEYDDFKNGGDMSFANSKMGEKLEWQQYLDNRKYVQGISIPNDIPLIVISATEWDFYDYHTKLMNSNKNSKHLRIEGTHGIHQEKPELIIDLIKELIDTM